MKGYCSNCKDVVEVSVDSFSHERICAICGIAIAEKNYEPGTVINGFKILNEIDCGPLWTVYRAFQINLERQVALKILSSKLSGDSTFVGRFFNKARIAASLNHPGIVQIYDAGVSDNGIYYLASELIEGETLKHRIDETGRMKKILSALKTAQAIAEALNYAWERNTLVHGDLKPVNIIMNGSSSARIADFGLLKYQTEEDRKAGMDSPFAAPELRNGQVTNFSVATDIYSFGALLYFMVTGHAPGIHKIKQASALNKEVKPNLENFLEKLLAADSAARPESWGDVLSKLEKIINSREKVHPQELQTNESLTSVEAPVKLDEPAPAKEKEPEKEESKEKKKVSALWIGVIASLAAVAIALGILVFTIHNASRTKTDPATLQKWQTIKEDIQFLDIDGAITKVKSFIDENGQRTPKEAIDTLNEMKEKEQKSKQEKANRENFRNRLALLEEILNNTILERENTTRLENIRKEIWSLNADAKKNSIPTIIFSNRSKSNLNEKLTKINTILKARTPPPAPTRKPAPAQQKPAQPQQKPQPAKTPAAAQPQKPAQPAAPDPKEKYIVNRMVDEYYTMLDQSMATGQDETEKKEAYKKGLEQWNKRYGPRTNSIWGRKAKLFSEILTEKVPVNTFLMNSQEMLKGKALPIKQYPEGYLVDSVDQTHIKLAKNDGKAILGKKIKTDSLTDDELTLIIGTVMLPSKKAQTLTPEQSASILIYLAEAGKYTEAKTLPALPKWNKDPKLYQELIEDLCTAHTEAKAVSQWKIIQDALKEKNPYTAANAMMIISNECQETSFAKRYAAELKGFSYRFDRLTPTILAEKYFAANTESMPEDQKIFQDITAYNRFGTLDAENPATKEKAEALKKAFQSLPGRQKEFTDDDKALPFMNWEKTVPGEVRAYQSFLMKKNTLRKDDSIFKLFSLGAALDSHNWKAVKTLYDKDINYNALFGESFKNRKWAPYLTFAGAFAAERLGDGRSAKKNLNSLAEMNTKADDGESKTASCILLMEYAIMSGFPEAAISTAGKFDFDNSVEIEDFKIKLLNIYALLESSQTDRNTIEETINELNKKYSDKNDFKGDTAWCMAALKVLKGCPEQEKKWIVNNLKPLLCYAPDICARILAAAYARNQYQDPNANFDKRFASEIAEFTGSKTGTTAASSELWEKSALLKLASAANMQELENVIKKLFADYNPASIRSYSFLCFLYAGIDALKNKTPKESSHTLLTAFFNASPAATDSDIRAASIATKTSPRELLFELMTDKDSYGAFNASLLGIMLFQGQDRLNIYTTMSELEKNLSFEKKLLLKRLSKYIK